MFSYICPHRKWVYGKHPVRQLENTNFFIYFWFMRKLLSILSIALVSLIAVGCDNDTENKGNGGTTIGGFTFGTPEVICSAAKVSVTPEDDTVTYLAGILDNSKIEALDDAAIITNFKQKLSKYVGKQTVVANALSAETDYTLVAFREDAIDEVSKLAIRTTPYVEPMGSEEFDVVIEVKDVKATSAVVTAKPNSVNNRYYFRVLTKLELDAFGIYNNDLQIFSYILENPNSGYHVTFGDTTLECELYPEMDYVAIGFNFENWEAVYSGDEDVKLFRQAFTTPKADPVDPNSLFKVSNLSTTQSDFSLDVTPVKGEDAHWIYYIWTKKSYDETLATEATASIMTRSYFALQNIAVEQKMTFNQLIQADKLGQVGSQTIFAYEPLKNDTEYVAVLFYIDPNSVDCTEVTDYNYVPVEFRTLAATAGAAATLGVSEPVIEKDGFKYNVSFLVKTNANAVDIKVGVQLWDNYDFSQYWDPNDWSQIQAFFLFRKSVGADTLAAAKSEEGATISFPGIDKGDYVFFFEALNAENTPTQFAVRVKPEMFQ